MNNKTILITGGAGYIGSQTSYELIDAGYSVVVLDNLINGHRQAVPPEAVFVEGDIHDQTILEKVFPQHAIGGVIHFAADPAINADKPENFEMYYRNNLFGLFSVLEPMGKYRVKNIVFSSTAAVYGMPTSLPIVESQPLEPLNMYGRTKLMAEQMLQDYSRMMHCNVTRLRYFNASGADLEGRTGESHDPETHLIPIILDVVAGKHDKIFVFGNDYDTKDGTCVRDYIHTKDLAKAHILAMEKMMTSDRLWCEAFNVGTGEGYTNLEIIKMVESVTGSKVAYEFAARRPGDWDSAYADNTKIKSRLGWNHTYSDLETIITSAWNWYKKNALR